MRVLKVFVRNLFCSTDVFAANLELVAARTDVIREFLNDDFSLRRENGKRGRSMRRYAPS